MKNAVALNAPAKINLHLAVGRRQACGFHEIESVFCKINIYDTIEVIRGVDDASTKVKLDLNALPAKCARQLEEMSESENIVYKAVEVFREHSGLEAGICVKLKKRIPCGAGLGGGSSDAAAVLTALNTLFPIPYPISSIAASLGSDVPFFLNAKSAARITGRGEIVSPFCLERTELVVIQPDFSSGTARAYKLLDETRNVNEFCGSKQGARNDFLDMFLKHGTEEEKETYAAILDAMREEGAIFTGLTGSGSACFGIFESEKLSARAADVLRRQHKNWPFIINCHTL